MISINRDFCNNVKMDDKGLLKANITDAADVPTKHSQYLNTVSIIHLLIYFTMTYDQLVEFAQKYMPKRMQHFPQPLPAFVN